MRRVALRLTDSRTREVAFEGERVHRGLPCPICAHLHRRQSWCLVDQYRGLAICPRVQSDRPIGAAGWLHSLDGSPPRLGEVWVEAGPPADDLPDMGGLLARARLDVSELDDRVVELSKAWGVPTASIHRLRPGWDRERGCYLFPMYAWDRAGAWIVCGLRTRRGTRKAAVTGSRNGILVPDGREKPDRSRDLYVVEGESDLAAALWLGLQAIARPGCLAVESLAVRYSAGCDVVIVRDNDGPGRDGAQRLRLLMKDRARSVAVLDPPPNFKDLRELAKV